MLPRLSAEETLDRVHAAAIGSGAVSQPQAGRALAELERRARGASRSAAPPDPRALAVIGIEVRPAPGRDPGEA